MNRVLQSMVIFALLSVPGAAGADAGRGLVTSGSCPLSCSDFGLSADTCREWQKGARCFVEDLTQPPGHRTMLRLPRKTRVASAVKSHTENSRLRGSTDSRPTAAEVRPAAPGQRGLVTTGPCPYSCASEGLTSQVCREWQEGGTCHVEDLTQPAGHRTLMKLK